MDVINMILAFISLVLSTIILIFNIVIINLIVYIEDNLN